MVRYLKQDKTPHSNDEKCYNRFVSAAVDLPYPLQAEETKRKSEIDRLRKEALDLKAALEKAEKEAAEANAEAQKLKEQLAKATAEEKQLRSKVDSLSKQFLFLFPYPMPFESVSFASLKCFQTMTLS